MIISLVWTKCIVFVFIKSRFDVWYHNHLINKNKRFNLYNSKSLAWKSIDCDPETLMRNYRLCKICVRHFLNLFLWSDILFVFNDNHRNLTRCRCNKGQSRSGFHNFVFLLDWTTGYWNFQSWSINGKWTLYDRAGVTRVLRWS